MSKALNGASVMQTEEASASSDRQVVRRHFLSSSIFGNTESVFHHQRHCQPVTMTVVFNIDEKLSKVPGASVTSM